MDGMDSMPVEEAQISARRCSGAEFLKGINPPRPVRLVGTICAIEAAHFTIITHDDAKVTLVIDDPGLLEGISPGVVIEVITQGSPQDAVALVATPLGTHFDIDVYRQAMHYVEDPQYADLFNPE